MMAMSWNLCCTIVSSLLLKVKRQKKEQQQTGAQMDDAQLPAHLNINAHYLVMSLSVIQLIMRK